MGRVSISIFLCYIRYYLHYGFKLSMLLKYNILLVITLLRCLLNMCVRVFKPHDFMLSFLAKKMSLLSLKIYEVVAIFKCLNTLKGRGLVFAFWLGYLLVFVAASTIRPSTQ